MVGMAASAFNPSSMEVKAEGEGYTVIFGYIQNSRQPEIVYDFQSQTTARKEYCSKHTYTVFVWTYLFNSLGKCQRP